MNRQKLLNRIGTIHTCSENDFACNFCDFNTKEFVEMPCYICLNLLSADQYFKKNEKEETIL